MVSAPYQLNLFAVPTLVTAGLLLALGLAVPVSEKRSRASVLFAVLCLTLAVWLGSYSMMYVAGSEQVAFWWCRLGFLGIPFIPAAAYHFVLSLLGKYQQQRFYVWLFWVISLFFAERAVNSEIFFTGVDRFRWGYYPRFNTAGALFLGYFVMPMLAAIWHLWTEYRSQTGEKQRMRIRAFLIAFAIGYVALVDFLPSFGFAIYPFGYAPLLIFAFLSAQAIRRYRLVTITPALAATQIMDTMSGAVIVTDQTDTITVANRAACQILGYEENELIGMPVSSVLPDPIGDKSPRLYRNHPMTWRRKDGRTVEVSVSASILSARGQVPAGIVYTALDISELKHAEQEVKSTASLLRSTLETTADGILVIDLQGKIVSFNQRFAQMWRIPREILDARDDNLAIEFVLNQLKEPDQFVAKISELYAQPEAESFDILEFKDGRVFERYSAPQRLDDVPVGRVWSFRDATDRRRAEESVRRREMIMEAVGYAAEQFLMTADWRSTIDPVLERLGKATEVSRVYIYQSHRSESGQQLYSQRYEWAAEGSQSLIADPRFQNMPVPKGFEETVERLSRGEVVQSHFSELTEEQRASLQGVEMRSMIIVPITVANRMWGSIGFTDSRRERKWLPVEIEALKAAAEILGAAIQRQESADALQTSETRYRLLFERNLAGVFRVTLEGRIIDCNDACARIFGFSSREEFLAQGATELYFDPAERERFIRQLLERRALTNVELRLRRRDGGAVWVLENVSLLVEDGGEPILEGTLIDITNRKVAEQQIEYQAYHDALTGLPNRMLFQDRLTMALAHAHRLHQPVSVMFFDLDHFKFVNDTLGHTVGDQLLKGVAERLRAALREEDTVARLGGDEFTLLLSHLGTEEDAAKIAQKLLETVAKPFTIDNHELYVTTSIGIAMYPDDGDDAETLLKNADSAMYRAKELGRNTYQLCTPAMNRRALERLSMESSLRRALERQEFVLHYQPQVHIASGEIVGMEALLRWNHPDRGLVSATEFIGIAEDTRLIFPLGEWVIREACRQAQAWREFSCNTMRMAVNLSARQFQQRDIIKTIDRALIESGLPASCLELEITEGIAMQNTEYSIAIMRELKSMGVMIAMDDFGTGHSSLSYLKRFPIDTIKIDQAFIRDLRVGSDAAIVNAMITMANGMKLRIVAEGVETEEQLRFLKANHCEIMQGFHFSEPRPARELEELLRRDAAARARSAVSG